MKRFLLIFISVLLVFSFCLSMSACSFYRFEAGYSYFGELPSMFIGVKTNKLKYYTDYVQLDVAFGWADGYLNESGQENYDNYSVLIVAYDDDAVGDLSYNQPVSDYSSYFSSDKIFVLKEIPKEDLLCGSYVASTSSYWTAKVKYNTIEKLMLPEELFADMDKDSYTVYLEIVLIGYSMEENCYLALYSNNIRLYFKNVGNGKIKLDK